MGWGGGEAEVFVWNPQNRPLHTVGNFSALSIAIFSRSRSHPIKYDVTVPIKL